MFLWRWIEQWIVQWLRDRHGAWEPHQWQFYRCEGCRAIASWHIIKSGGCACRESSKVRPAILTRMEKLRILVLPWTITPPARRRVALAAERALAARQAAQDAARRATAPQVPA